MASKSLQFDLGGRSYRFTFKVGFFVLCLFFFVLFCKLGFWQLYRYHFKKNALTTYDQHSLAAPIPFADALKNHDHRFQAVVVSGQYDNKLQILISNRFNHDKPGFEVLTPLQIPNDEKLLLIDRGWIEDGAIPHIPDVTDNQTITGYIKLLDEKQFILGKNILAANTSPFILQKIDIADISRITHKSYYPFILRLDPNQPNGFVRDWIISASPPERNLGYAIQWFMMAAVLFIAYFCFACERIKHDNSN